MPTAPLSRHDHARILQCFKDNPKITTEAAAAKLQLGHGTIIKYRKLPLVEDPVTPEPIEPDFHASVKAQLRKGHRNVDSLSDSLDCGISKVREAIAQMKARGVLIHEHADGYSLSEPGMDERGKTELAGTDDYWTHRFGITTDNHLCNKHSRLDVLNEAYDTFEREGITNVFNCGNWIDGEARFNKTELITAPGMDNQLDYMIDKWPVKKGIATQLIAGDDHEGWYAQRERIEIGKYLQLRAEDQGRHDLKYLGYGEHDLELRHGSGTAVMRLCHPGGGSAYAHSYTGQKLVESYQGGEKPNVLLLGHYHKWNVDYPREVHLVQCGCTCDQTLFMRKKKIQAHVGFVIVKIKQDEQGIVTRFAAEWFPFYNRGFYENKRFV
jgi:hypothetical protein